MSFSLNYAIVVMVVALGVFGTLMALLPGQLIINQVDYVSPTTQSQEVASYYSAHNLTVYKNTWSFDIDYGTMEYNQSGLADGHRLEFFWDNQGGVLNPIPAIHVRHAYPSPLGEWWLWSNNMALIEPYLSLSQIEWNAWTITKAMLLRLQTNSNSSYFECSDGAITANFVVMNANSTAYSDLSESWDGLRLHVLSSFEVDFDAMKPNAWWLIAQIVTFQAPNLGIPGVFGDVLTYIFGIGFWVTVAIILYTIVTRLIPTLQGGIES